MYAWEAKKQMKKYKDDYIKIVLSEIKTLSARGKGGYNPQQFLTQSEISTIEDLGYLVTEISMDGYKYHSISWS